MKKKIMFTGGGGAGAEAIWRVLSKKYDMYFADSCVSNISDVIPEKNKIAIPLAHSDNFKYIVKNICQELHIDILVPCVDEELLILSSCHNNDMPEMLLPSYGFVNLMLDKFEFAVSLKNKGLNIPETTHLSEAKKIGFPLVIKPKNGRGSRGVMILNSEDEIESYKVLFKKDDSALLVQQLIIGTEYTVQVAGDKKGVLKAIIPVKVKQKKGITIRAHTDLNSEVIAYCQSFHDIFHPTGVYNIQCMVTDKGEVFSFEVNPRISTTFCLGLASGFDPFSDEYKLSDTTVFYPLDAYCLKRSWSNNIKKIVV